MTAMLQIQPVALPLASDKYGVVKVGGTRVTLDTIVKAFLRGATAEEIAQQYPSVSLADGYATISYYLQNQKAVDSYLAKRKKQAQTVKAENEKRFDTQGIRERLLARKK
jgi:uncharacterized protein (DUF433 family)